MIKIQYDEITEIHIAGIDEFEAKLKMTGGPEKIAMNSTIWKK